ncbi:hypothetical protein HO133_007204 [Letharia lupina]|uniref:LYC1 C-terminal domain-containing protein n=1 Tax=Letharia lupina TaxID=560253 RepID=A0A8H6FID1_9LECA|nr:uncharacterized protein HO133_007204 [Letharia lupina]KAF6229090.1 hypothetical protein HO133_007204 [Letharia lupina]
MATYELPSSDSPDLALLHPTQEEKVETWKLNGASWRGAMPLPIYLRRETYLENQAFTKDGGITFWILVDSTLPRNERPILGSCESFRKRALVARDGKVEDVVSHGIGSVFCNPDYRRRGFAQRMIEELGKKLDTWNQEDRKKTDFTVLYSDIGKKFYSKFGWKSFPSSHIALAPMSSESESALSGARPLRADDLKELCSWDEQLLRADIARDVPRKKIRVALIPDLKTMQWHHAREEFAGREMLGREPDIKGAHADCEDSSQVWCIWTRTFGSTEAGNTLNILRFFIDGENDAVRDESEAGDDLTDLKSTDQAKLHGAVAVLHAAQVEAARWEMKDVQIWNPSSLIVLAARQIEPSTKLIHRDDESIASLRWHGEPEERTKVEWVGNEKYAWC